MLSEAFSRLVLDKIDAEAPLTEESLQKLIIALCDYHESSRHCVKKYDSVALMIEERQESPAALAQRIVPLISGGIPFLYPPGNHAGMQRYE
ncbi:hypothetical protein D3C74_443150 [compost metagenome]